MKKSLRKLIALTFTSTLVLGSLAGCGGEEGVPEGDGTSATIVKVGVVGEYNAQWDTINELLAPDNIQVELVKFTDYATPNRALSDGDLDLNAFQHKAHLNNEIEEVGYDLAILADTISAPLGIFNNTDKITSVEEIKDGDIIAIPSDRTNNGRSLKLLESAGLIECDPEKGVLPTVADITKYNVDIEIMEAESATLASLLPDTTAAIINTGNAITAGLSYIEDTIFMEDSNPETNPNAVALVNVIAVRTEDKENEVYKKIGAAYQTQEVKDTLEEEYKGAFIPIW